MSRNQSLWKQAASAVSGAIRWRVGSMRRAMMRARAKLHSAFGNPPLKQIIICGYSRGGTSLLYNMLSSSIEGFKCEEYEAYAIDLIHRWGNIASKDPSDVFNIPKVVAANVYGKQLHVIACIRDPRDVLTSIHPKMPDRYMINYADRWSPQGAYPNYTLERIPLGIRAVHTAIRDLETQPGIRLHKVRYEDVIADADAVQARLARDMGVAFRHNFSEFHKHPESHAYHYNGKVAPIDPSLVRENSAVDASRKGKWRKEEHRERIHSEFAAHPELFEILRDYGYEQDDAWFDEYREATPAEPALDTVSS